MQAKKYMFLKITMIFLLCLPCIRCAEDIGKKLKKEDKSELTEEQPSLEFIKVTEIKTGVFRLPVTRDNVRRKKLFTFVPEDQRNPNIPEVLVPGDSLQISSENFSGIGYLEITTSVPMEKLFAKDLIDPLKNDLKIEDGFLVRLVGLELKKPISPILFMFLKGARSLVVQQNSEKSYEVKKINTEIPKDLNRTADLFYAMQNPPPMAFAFAEPLDKSKMDQFIKSGISSESAPWPKEDNSPDDTSLSLSGSAANKDRQRSSQEDAFQLAQTPVVQNPTSSSSFSNNDTCSASDNNCNCGQLSLPMNPTLECGVSPGFDKVQVNVAGEVPSTEPISLELRNTVAHDKTGSPVNPSPFTQLPKFVAQRSGIPNPLFGAHPMVLLAFKVGGVVQKIASICGQPEQITTVADTGSCCRQGPNGPFVFNSLTHHRSCSDEIQPAYDQTCDFNNQCARLVKGSNGVTMTPNGLQCTCPDGGSRPAIAGETCEPTWCALSNQVVFPAGAQEPWQVLEYGKGNPPKDSKVVKRDVSKTECFSQNNCKPPYSQLRLLNLNQRKCVATPFQLEGICYQKDLPPNKKQLLFVPSGAQPPQPPWKPFLSTIWQNCLRCPAGYSIPLSGDNREIVCKQALEEETRFCYATRYQRPRDRFVLDFNNQPPHASSARVHRTKVTRAECLKPSNCPPDYMKEFRVSEAPPNKAICFAEEVEERRNCYTYNNRNGSLTKHFSSSAPLGAGLKMEANLTRGECLACPLGYLSAVDGDQTTCTDPSNENKITTDL